MTVVKHAVRIAELGSTAMKYALRSLTGDALVLLPLSLLSMLLVTGLFWAAGISPLPVEKSWAAVLPDGTEKRFPSAEGLQRFWQENPGIRRAATIGYGYAEDAGEIVLWSGILSIAGFGVLAAARSPESRRRWLTGTPADLVWGVAAGGVLLAIGFAYQKGIASLGIPLRDVGSMWRALGSTFSLAMLACVVAPIAEEAYFRGRLYDLLAASTSTRTAILISGAFFGCAHVLPEMIPIAFLFGCALGWLRVRRGNLIAPIVAHAVNNGVGLFLLS